MSKFQVVPFCRKAVLEEIQPQGSNIEMTSRQVVHPNASNLKCLSIHSPLDGLCKTFWIAVHINDLNITITVVIVQGTGLRRFPRKSKNLFLNFVQWWARFWYHWGNISDSSLSYVTEFVNSCIGIKPYLESFLFAILSHS